MSEVAADMTWTDVAGIDDLPRRGSRVVATTIGDIALFRTADDSIFALEDRCPHKGGPLSQGIIHGHKVTCPLHNWVIDLGSGQATEPDVGCAQVIGVQVKAGRILLNLVR